MRLVQFYILTLTVFIYGCTSSGDRNQSADDNDTMKRDWPAVPVDSARIITLPTPMQIPALLKNSKALYSKDLLFPIDHTTKSFFKSNLLFGMYMMDLAYSCSFSDIQTSKAYFNKCRIIAGDLGLGTKFNENLITRFDNNIERPDSLGRIVLEMYKYGHSYFNVNDKEGVGLILIMGCLFEGMHIGYNQARNHDLVLFFHILSQQKIYTENLLYALEGYEIPTEIKAEYDLLVRADEIFRKMNPPAAYKLDDGSASAANVDGKLLEELEEVVKEFREAAAI